MSIHSTAIIDPKAELDPSVTVGPYCVIEANVHVAAGCRLYQNVYVTGWTRIGEDCELHPGVIVGHEPQDTKYTGERTYCRIGRGTILREYVTVHRGTIPESETAIGEDCLLLAGSHIGHNCLLGNRVTLINNVLLGGHVEVGEQATLGGAVGVHQFVRIGELAMVAGTARVIMDVVPFAMAGVDGRIAGLNRVGLRRAETPRAHVRALRDAYRIVFERGLPLKEAVEQIFPGEGSCPSVEALLSFLRGASRRGLAGLSRRRRVRSGKVDGDR